MKKDFGSWSPRDHSPDALNFLIELEDEFRGHWNLPPRPWKKAEDQEG